MSESAPVEVSEHGAVRLVTLNRPAVLNAVNEELHTTLAGLWAALGADAGAGAVVLTGAGRAFCAGGDLDYLARFPTDAELRQRTMAEAQQLLWAMIRFPLPIVAAVNGPAVGLGLSLALASDIVLLAEDAYLADPHVAVGLVCGDGGAALLPVVAPLLRAKELLFTGDRIDAATAVALGIASRTVPAGEVLSEALALAQRLAAQPRFALRETKRAIQLGLEQRVAAVVAAAADAEERSMATDDHAARVAAMRQRAGQHH